MMPFTSHPPAHPPGSDGAASRGPQPAMANRPAATTPPAPAITHVATHRDYDGRSVQIRPLDHLQGGADSPRFSIR